MGGYNGRDPKNVHGGPQKSAREVWTLFLTREEVYGGWGGRRGRGNFKFGVFPIIAPPPLT